MTPQEKLEEIKDWPDKRIQRIIAKDYKVNITVISRIKSKKLWAHI